MKEKIEEIGKVRLDLTHYPGEDYYCDGEIEDELLEITRNYAEVEYPHIIEERKSWPVLYHLSALRENIVEWLPIDKSGKVLEVGSGCGAITGALARKAGEVTCVDLSRKRSLINAYRHMDCGNVTIHVGNFQDIEPDLPCDYDYICLIGVFEYGQAYIDSETPYEDFLRIIGKHKKNNGRIVIAIENKLGLKYWAGCKEDHLGTWFSSLEDYPEGGAVRTFTRDGLVKVAEKCGFSDVSVYYPYPDYKFMTSLYSDSRLPKPGELSSNLRNFDRERLQLFDEKLVFDTLIKEGQFPLFSNSYLMILGEAPEVKYARYSNDRADAFKIKTLLTEREAENGTVRQIEKHPLSNGAEEHIRQIGRAYEKLSERFAGGKLHVNKCKLKEDSIFGGKEENDISVIFEYIDGKTLEELLDECLEREDIDKFQLLFNEYLERISYREEAAVTDYDLIFSNILISADGRWHIIDYEWTFEKAVETKEIAFRAIYCYLLESEKRNKLNLDFILEKLGVSEADAESYRRQEMKFQKYVTGKRMSMEEIRDVIDQPIYALSELPMLSPAEKQKERVQIYEDKGEGFSEEQSFFLEEESGTARSGMERDGAERKFRLVFEGERKAVRIDPCSDSCIVYLKELLWNDKPIPMKGKSLSTNGIRAGEGVYAFSTQDPNITLLLAEREQKQENVLQVVMQVTKVPQETAEHMQKRGLF
ncbi:MAG: class I SAM-dependent methyltransferase [Blautia sp.]|nr:class I SAM-dependent methyltransferase [Blautia sp.]MCM1199629.1 class I SAM-dependent methyltransferase [Bacteroides fragilis]